jgi:hypothetical protein
MKKKQLLYLVLCNIFCFLSCENNNIIQENNKTITVASKKVDCVGVGPQTCLLIKKENQESWTYFYDTIIGFEYEEGFEYEILVSERNIKNPPQDASSIETTLITIISKIEKPSENLPN